MSNYDHLLHKVKAYVHDFYREHKNEAYHYHDPRHTRDVVKAAQTITAYYEIKGEDHFVVITAAWFHDLGYFIDRAHHEEKGADMAAKFLAAEHVGDEVIQKVRGCIMATKLPQHPLNLLEEIMCDADLFHFGTKEFRKKSKLLLEEYNNLHDPPMSKSTWRDKTIAMMEAHHYFTDYGLLYLTRDKENNIRKLIEKAHHDIIKTEMEVPENQEQKHHHRHSKDERPASKERPEKGIETMFRISSNNHSRLSDMADNKAHILITVNSIILSAVISLVLRKLENNEYLMLPSFILLAVSLATMIFAILATRPTIPNGQFMPDDIIEKKVNLLFFGNFYRMDLDKYRDAMLKVMDDHDFLYDNLIRDVYAQGVVLGRKYHLLRIAYNVFMFGLIVAVVAFIIATATSHPNPHALLPKAMAALFPSGGFE
jgi:predicted metal-dependent HD superfamily phosphohydrolase